MNELTAGKTMTVSQVAVILGYKKDTIRKKVKELFPEIVENGIVTELTEEQVLELKSVLVPRTLALKSEVSKATTDLEMVEKMHDVMSWLNSKLLEKDNKIAEQNSTIFALNCRNEKLQIELDQSCKWYSVKRVQIAGYLKDKDPREIWRPLKEYSIANDYQIKTIFDPNFGNVKTYHSEVWKSVYGVEI